MSHETNNEELNTDERTSELITNTEKQKDTIQTVLPEEITGDINASLKAISTEITGASKELNNDGDASKAEPETPEAPSETSDSGNIESDDIKEFEPGGPEAVNIGIAGTSEYQEAQRFWDEYEKDNNKDVAEANEKVKKDLPEASNSADIKESSKDEIEEFKAGGPEAVNIGTAGNPELQEAQRFWDEYEQESTEAKPESSAETNDNKRETLRNRLFSYLREVKEGIKGRIESLIPERKGLIGRLKSYFEKSKFFKKVTNLSKEFFNSPKNNEPHRSFESVVVNADISENKDQEFSEGEKDSSTESGDNKKETLRNRLFSYLGEKKESINKKIESLTSERKNLWPRIKRFFKLNNLFKKINEFAEKNEKENKAVEKTPEELEKERLEKEKLEKEKKSERLEKELYSLNRQANTKGKKLMKMESGGKNETKEAEKEYEEAYRLYKKKLEEYAKHLSITSKELIIQLNKKKYPKKTEIQNRIAEEFDKKNKQES